MLATHFRRFLVLFVMVGLVTAVSALAAQATPPRQEDRPSRTGIEDIPHYPLAETSEVGLAWESVTVVPASKVAFQSYRNGNWDIFVGNDDGAGQTAVTSHIRADIHPHLNRGSTAVVYASRSDDHDYEIYRVNVDGSNRVALTNNEADDGNPQWSPNGTRIVFESYRDGQAEIYVMNADGSGQTRLTTNGAFDGMPSWSPDGTKIAFSSSRSGAYRIWVMNANGSNPVRLSNQPYSFRPQWSPDGSKIAYDADGNNDGWQELWWMNADGSDQQAELTATNNTDLWVGSWSPDGRYIAITRIHFVYYQGNWYWDYAYQEGRDINLYNYDLATFPLSQSDVDWHPRWQTNDTQPPTSQVQVLPAVAPAPITVRWAGNDTGGSGLRSYDVQVKTGANGTWTDWLVGTAAASGAYNGIGGQTYQFRSRARDNAFNVEAWPASADSSTVVESLPPHSFIAPLPPYSRLDQGVTVSWGGSDPGGSGIATYDLQYQIDGGNWVNWQTDTTETSSLFGVSVAGNTYAFRVKATDRAQNDGNWSTAASDSQTTFYKWGVTGTAFDNAGAPVSAVEVTTAPGLLAVIADDPDGKYAAYIAAAATTYTASWNKNGYGSLPATAFQGEMNGSTSPNGEQDVFLPPANNVVQNWGFESGGFDAWQPSGVVTAVVTTDTQHTGQFVAHLGTNSLFEPIQAVSNGQSALTVVDSSNATHLIFNEGASGAVYYTQRPQHGVWSSPQSISPGINADSYTTRIILDQNEILHVVWSGHPSDDYSHTRVFYARRNINGIWSTPVEVSIGVNGQNPDLAVDGNGVVHVVWHGDYDLSIYYTRRATNGNWSAPTQISLTSGYNTSYPKIAVENSGVVHVVWREYGGSNLEHLSYAQRNTNGVWTTSQVVVDNFATLVQPMLAIGSQQDVHLVWQGRESFSVEPSLYYARFHNGLWSAPHPIALSDFYFTPDMTTGSDGSLHLVWSDKSFSANQTQDALYIKRNSNGIWSTIQNLTFDRGNSSASARVAVNPMGLPHVIWVSWFFNSNGVFHTQQRSDGTWTPPRFVSAETGITQNPELSIGQLGDARITWDSGAVFYTAQALAEETGDVAVSQMFTVPITMTNPTLSFLYQLVGSSAEYNTGFFVEVDDGTAVTPLLSTSEEVGDWQHEWVNLAEWSGENITLTFRLHQEEDAPLLYAYLDEVTVGSTYSDVDIDVINDTAVLPGKETTLSLIYNNRGGAAASGVTITYTLPAGMTYLSASIPPASTNPLVWHLPDLPAKSEPFEILVTARVNANTPAFTTLTSTAVISTTDPELELLNNQAEGHIYTATFRYLPIIMR